LLHFGQNDLELKNNIKNKMIGIWDGTSRGEALRPLFPDLVGILKCWFLYGEENQRTRRKTLSARREPTTNSAHL